MKQSFWKTDWFTALVVLLLFFIMANAGLFEGVEQTLYDVGVGATEREPSKKVVIVAIDDESIAKIGRWPWSRTVIAEMITILDKANAKIIGNTMLYLQPQRDAGYEKIKAIKKEFNKTVLADKKALQKMTGAKAVEVAKSAEYIGKMLDQAVKKLNTDVILARSYLKAKNVVQTMNFEIGTPQERLNPDELSKYIKRNSLRNIKDNVEAVTNNLLPLKTKALYEPYKLYAKTASALGHGNIYKDDDGKIRKASLVVDYGNVYFPSFAVQVVARSLGVSQKRIQVSLGEGIKIGNIDIKTNPELEMNTFFYSDKNDKPPFIEFSFYDVLEGKINLRSFAGKIVLLGQTATGIGGEKMATPINPEMDSLIYTAHTVSSLLKQDYFISPAWAGYIQLALLLLIAVYLMFIMPRLKAGQSAMITLALLLIMLGLYFYTMTSLTIWLKLALPVMLLIIGYMVMTTKRFLFTEERAEKSDASSAQSNRMLALQFQEQGQFDQAFDAFRKVPVDNGLIEAMYNLALDFERKRQFNKAGSVFTYIAEHNEKFRDVKARIERNKQLEHTVIMGGASGANTALVLDGEGIEKPKLGRYVVEKELGKGAMGVVYLGKDPTINRVVAIKTMALAQEFDGNELVEVKARFFREAETAGRLNHPNIVTIYDAGEEHDLAYISMEFLQGEDLVPYTKPNKLLPLEKALTIVMQVADALDFAHKQRVVHRDIKPANVMYHAESESVKVTDFGIARITDSSRTKTGMVLGTPSYMSPEQLAGKKVDGRSDIFSLGVMLYQMVTSQLPFTGDSMATLMYKIANERHRDIKSIKNDLPDCLRKIVNKVLEKGTEKRYQTGADLANDIKSCLEEIKGG